jgi:hypothetical protein
MAIIYNSGRRIQATNSDRELVNRGTIDTSSSAGNTIITFTEDGIFTPTSSFNVEYLVVAGGGAGGAGWRGGGGGAGGYRTSAGTSGGGASAESSLSLTAQSYSITVGAGGTGTTTEGNNGSNSVFSTVTSLGGGGGGGEGDTTDPGLNGGSGGGGNGSWSTSGGGGGSGTSGQGYAGGAGLGSGSVQCGGGGGGAGNSGYAGGSGGTDGDGGAGTSSSISGTATYYAGGGGGGNYVGGNTTVGGTGGGGAGSRYIDTTIIGYSGTVNTGGGGGGTGSSGAGGAGGSGIVIIKFATSGNTYDTSAGGKPVNVQIGSRLEETDTRKMYHYGRVAGAIIKDAQATVNTSSTGTDNPTLSLTVGDNYNRILVVSAGRYGAGGDISGITWNGTEAFTRAHYQDGSEIPSRTEIWYLINPTVGAGTVSATWDASTGRRSIGVYSFYNAEQTSPIGVTDDDDGEAVTTSSTVSPTTTGSMIIDCIVSNTNTAPTDALTAGWSTLIGGDDRTQSSQYDLSPTIGSTNAMAWAFGSEKAYNWIAIEIKSLKWSEEGT